MKKALNIVKKIFAWIVVVIAVGMMIFTIVSVNTFDRNDRDVFGYKAYIILTDSMSAVKDDPSHGGYFNAGDLIIVKEVDPATLKAGDIVSYMSTNSENFGKTVTHMIKTVTTDANGRPGFVTYGTTTGVEDANIVTYEYILGQYKATLPGVGQFFQFLKTVPGYIICIFLPFLVLIVMQGFNSVRLFKKYKAEQMAELDEKRAKELSEIQAEREKMEEERKRQEEMMQKLLAMQAAMQANVQPAQNAEAEPQSTEAEPKKAEDDTSSES